MFKTQTQFMKRGIATFLSAALTLSTFATAVISGGFFKASAADAPTKVLIVDDFTDSNVKYATKNESAGTKLEVKDGSLTMTSQAHMDGYGFVFSATDLAEVSTAGYEYLEFDVYTDNPNIFVKSMNAFVQFGRGSVDRSHDIPNLQQSAANAVGALTKDAVTTIKLPLSKFQNRAAMGNAAALSINPDKNPATNISFDNYLFYVRYNGTYNLGTGTQYTVRVDQVRLTSYSAPAPASKSVVVDDFTNAAENYSLQDHGNQGTLVVSDGSLTMTNSGMAYNNTNKLGYGFHYNAVNLDNFTTTGYEYIEFDIWTDTEDLYFKSNDSRINLGVDTVDRTHDIGSLANTAANAVGKLKANQVNTVRIPLSKFTTRTDTNAASKNPEAKAATDFTFNRYTFMVGYSGSNVLGTNANAKYTVRIDEVRLTAYENTNQIAVDKVITAISAIGVVEDHDSDELVIAARALYDELNPKEKTLVTNYAELTAAETLLATIPYKTTVFDPYDPNKATYTRIPNSITNQALSFESGVLEITTPSDNTRQGYGYTTYLSESVTMADYEYLEFDIWTNNANIFADPLDARIMLGVYDGTAGTDTTDVGKAHYQYSSLKSISSQIKANEWVHIKVPYSAFSVRAEAGGTALKEATLNRYNWFVKYNGTKNLGEGDFRVKLQNMVLTSYEKPTTEEWNQQKAQEVDALIDAIKTPVTLESEASITAARSAYEALKSVQKALVTKLNALTAAETTLAGLKSDAAVANTIKLINDIGTPITLESGSAIKAARAAYNALTSAEQAKITNFATLTEAEATWAKLDAEANPATQTINIDPFTGDYVYTKLDNKVFSYEVKDGVVTMSSWANDHEHGFYLKGTLPSVYKLNNFDYLEFDILTTDANVYKKANDCRFWLMGDNGTTNALGYNSDAAATKEAVGTLEAGKWVHVKFPLELIYNRADKNIKANNATVDAYTIQMTYNGQNNLGGSADNPVVVKIKNLNLTSYQKDASYTETSKTDSQPVKEVEIEDFDDLAYMTFDQASEYYAKDEYLEIANTADAHDTGFDFTMNFPEDVNISGCDYLEFDFYTNDVGVVTSSLDCRMFLAFSGVMDGLNANQLMAAKMKELMNNVQANQWTHVRIPLSAFTYSSENVGKLDMDLATLCKIGIFFRFNGANKLDGYTEDNPAVVRFKNLKATKYEGTPSFISSNQEFTVTFKANGDTVATTKVKYGHGAEAPAAPVRSGYTFNGWDSDFNYVTKSMTVTAQYHEDSQAILKSEAEAALTAIASSITNANLKAQAALVAEARQAVATLINKYPSVKTADIAGYSKLAAAEKQILALTKTTAGIDGEKDSIYKEENSVVLNDYTSAAGNKKLPDGATDGKAYYAWDNDFIYVYIEYPESVERIEARIDTDPALNKGDYRGVYATYNKAQSDSIIRRNTDGTLYCSSDYGTAVNISTLNKNGKKTLEFAWPRAWTSGASIEDHFGLSVYATRADQKAYTVSGYYDWDNYKTIHYYYTMSRAELIAQAEKLINAIGEVTEENWSDKDTAIEAARTLIDNAKTSYSDFSTDQVSNYIKLREAEHKFNYYFAVGEGTVPSMPPLEEIDLMVSTESEDIDINLLSKVIQVSRKMTVAEFLSLLEYDQGTPTIINRDGRVLKGTSYVHDDLRMLLTVDGVGQATFAILYLGDEEITEPDELEPLPDGNTSGGNSGNIDNPGDITDTGVQSLALLSVIAMMGSVIVVTVLRKKRSK